MYQPILTMTLLASAFLWPLQVAQAKTFNMQPGLWEVRASSDLLKLVAHMPADQMQTMQDLAKEYGLEIPEIENGAAISYTCITQEMAAQRTPPQLYQEELGCASKKIVREGNTYKVNYQCNGADLTGHGFAQGTITSSKTFAGRTRFTGKARGAPVDEKAEFTGKWISASCGDVKP